MAGGGWMSLMQLTLDKARLVMAGDGLHSLHLPEQKQEPGGRREQWGLLSIQCFTVVLAALESSPACRAQSGWPC